MREERVSANVMVRDMQEAIDTTLSSLHPRCANVDGAALRVARRKKEWACPELAGPLAWSCWLGRWDSAGQRIPARGKVRHEQVVLKRRVQQAWRMLELRGSTADGDTPQSHEVESTVKYARLGSS